MLKAVLVILQQQQIIKSGMRLRQLEYLLVFALFGGLRLLLATQPQFFLLIMVDYVYFPSL